MHYLDNSATTMVSPEAAKKALEMMTEVFANPSSLHAFGIRAEAEVEAARKAVAAQLGCSDEEILFTSGGTEANNLALFGVAEARKRRCRKIVVSSVEHSSVIEAAKKLENDGFTVGYVAPRADGIIHPEDVAAAVGDDTSLVSVMRVNNETGAVMPVADIFEEVRDVNPDVICHTDAVQAFGKLECKVKKLGADLLTVSAHKVHAPKGCGALYFKKGVRFVPRQYGGEQQKKRRPGTEAAQNIAAFGVACEQFDIRATAAYVRQLNDYAKEKLLSIEGVVLNSPADALPYVLNITAGRVRSETMLHHLEKREIYLSSGSACAKGKPSHVLSAMGYDKNRADSALRVSFSKYNTKEDIDALAEGIAIGLRTLAHA